MHFCTSGIAAHTFTMTHSPLISIITVTYNAGPVLEKTIKSVLAQTYTNIEYIVIDGASADETTSLIKKYEYGIKYWHSLKDDGIAQAFNRGLAHAQGEIVGFLNAGDWYEPDAVETVANRISDFDITYSNIRCWNNDKPFFVQNANHSLLLNEMTVNHPAVFVRKHCYEKFGMFNTQYACAMDYDLLLRLKLKECRFLYIPAVTTNMALNGISNNRWMLACWETLLIKNNQLAGSNLKYLLYYIKHISAIFISRLLEKTPFFVLIRTYRSHFAPIRRKYYKL
jgi:glycosyltransferase involved in cell wall biosynthesis